MEDRQGDARIDHEPEYGPVFHVPLTAARTADSSIAARRASGGSETALVHVPEYSAALPETVALLGWLLVGGVDEEGGEGAGTVWGEFTSWAVTVEPFCFLALVTLVSEPCAQG